MGDREVSQVPFVAPVRVGTTLLTAGDDVIHHTMEAQDHSMVFQRRNSKNEVQVKRTFVSAAKEGGQSKEGGQRLKIEEVYQLTAGNKRILPELIFRGDSAQHVFWSSVLN
jgi:hypothetical protein